MENKTLIFFLDARTQAVQPHAVNGHVLQHPTIALRRLNSSGSTASRRRSNQNTNPEESTSQEENRVDSQSGDVADNSQTNNEEEINEVSQTIFLVFL